MKIVVLCLFASVLVLLWIEVYVLKQMDKLRDVLAKQALKISNHESSIAAYEESDRHSFTKMLSEHDEKLKKITYHMEQIDKKIDELPVEDMEAQYEAEKAWNDGVQAIVNFGLDQLKGGNE